MMWVGTRSLVMWQNRVGTRNLVMLERKPVNKLCKIHNSSLNFLVCGDANFSMNTTALTICGFTQPNVARNLIELQASVENGLSPRFMWIFPKPSYAKFETLEVVNEEFISSIGKWY